MTINEGFALQKIAGSYVIVPLAAKLKQYNGLFRLNETAAYIFERSQAGEPEDQILSGLAKTFDIDPAQGRQWYCELAEILAQYGIVRADA